MKRITVLTLLLALLSFGTVSFAAAPAPTSDDCTCTHTTPTHMETVDLVR